MKTIKTILCLAAAVFAFASCSNNDGLAGEDNGSNAGTVENKPAEAVAYVKGATIVSVPAGVKTVHAYNWADGCDLGEMIVEDGTVAIESPYGCTTIALYYNGSAMSRAASDADALVQVPVSDGPITIQKTTEFPTVETPYTKFIELFPAGKNMMNEYYPNGVLTAPDGVDNFALNFMFESDGNPIDVLPVYSNGRYDVTLGIFYYDTEATMHSYAIWNMAESGWKLNNDRAAEVKTAASEAVRVELPAGYKYGFYIVAKSLRENEVFKGYTYTNTYPTTAYTWADLNKENLGCEHSQKCANYYNIHSATFSVNDETFIGFEDQENGDYDINDLIVRVTPTAKVISNPTKDDVKAPAAPAVVPEGADHLMHWSSECGMDIEARFDGQGHDYLRIAVPTNGNQTCTIDLTPFNAYCAADDFRIVTKDDMEVLYVEDNTTKSTDGVKAVNGNTTDEYKTVSCTTGNVQDGVYEMKVDLYPADEDDYLALIELIEQHKDNLCEWLLSFESSDAPVLPSDEVIEPYKSMLRQGVSPEWTSGDSYLPNMTEWKLLTITDRGLTLNADMVAQIESNASGTYFSKALSQAEGAVIVCACSSLGNPSWHLDSAIYDVRANGCLYKYDDSAAAFVHDDANCKVSH